jgi:branched-chain amino acid aminotransferase
MFLMNYSDGTWHSPRIVPYGPVSMPPGAICLHYGQTLFEGIKAFRHDDGEIYIFRPDKNAERLNVSADILCMPRIDGGTQLEAICRLIDVEREWCPKVRESSLYIRPFMFATEDALGVRPSSEYLFCIILSPSGPYYPGGFSQAIRLLVTKKFHRAVTGGTGASKTGGNYVASLRAAEFAHSFGAHQVLYLNADNSQIEEVGSMNHYHVLSDGTFIIPAFSDTILTSVTSMSVLELAELGKIKARQEIVMAEKFLEDVRTGRIVEAGGFGTAAVVSPVGSYVFEDGSILKVGDGGVGERSRALYEMYSAIQTGRVPAPEGWLTQVGRYT